MVILPDIRAEYRVIVKPSFDLPKKVAGLTRFVNEFVYNHIDTDLRRIRQKVVDFIYSHIQNPGRPKRLDRATIDYKQKINQYSSTYGIWFNYLAAPHLSTIIGDTSVLVKPRKGKYLTIPNTAGGIKPNARIRQFGITTVKFNPAIYGGVPYWYKGNYPKTGTRSPKGTRKSIKPSDWRRILFWGVQSVRKYPKISSSDIYNVVEPELQLVYHKLVAKGLINFFKVHK